MKALRNRRGSTFVSAVSLTAATKGTGILLSLLASVVVARHLGPEGKGVLAVLGVVSGLALQFGSLGLQASSAYFAAKTPEKAPAIAANALWVGGLVGGLCAAAIAAINVWVPGLLKDIPLAYLAVTLLTIPALLVATLFQNILLGLQLMSEYNLVELAAKIAGFFLSVLLLAVMARGVWEMILLGAALAVASAGGYVWLVIRGRQLDLAFDATLFRQMLGYGLKSYAACLMAFLIVRVDMLFVNYFLSPVEAGWYSVAVSFTDLLYLLPSILATILFSHVSAGSDRDASLTLRVSRCTILLYGLLCAAAGLLASPVIRFLYGERFMPAVAPFLWLLPGIFMFGMLNIFAQDLAGRGFPIFEVIVWIPGLLLNMALNALWIPRFGIAGAAWSSSVCYALLAAGHVWYFLRVTKVTLAAALLPGLDDVRRIAGVLGLRLGQL